MDKPHVRAVALCSPRLKHAGISERLDSLLPSGAFVGRLLINRGLGLWNEQYESVGKGLSYSILSKQLPELKKDEATKWLSEGDSTALHK